MTRRSLFAARCASLLALALGACDPAYTLGARTRLAPAPTPTCVGAALKSSPHYAEVRPLDSYQGTGFRVAVHDSVLAARGRLATGWYTVTVRVDTATARDSAGALSLSYMWMGGARSVPLDEQRRLLSVAADVLAGLRTACAPAASPSAVECFARGLGGAPACRAAS